MLGYYEIYFSKIALSSSEIKGSFDLSSGLILINDKNDGKDFLLVILVNLSPYKHYNYAYS